MGRGTFHRTVFDNDRVPLPSPLQETRDERFTSHDVRLLLKRDDLLHPTLIGNKYRKLTPKRPGASPRSASSGATNSPPAP